MNAILIERDEPDMIERQPFMRMDTPLGRVLSAMNLSAYDHLAAKEQDEKQRSLIEGILGFAGSAIEAIVCWRLGWPFVLAMFVVVVSALILCAVSGFVDDYEVHDWCDKLMLLSGGWLAWPVKVFMRDPEWLQRPFETYLTTYAGVPDYVTATARNVAGHCHGTLSCDLCVFWRRGSFWRKEVHYLLVCAVHADKKETHCIEKW